MSNFKCPNQWKQFHFKKLPSSSPSDPSLPLVILCKKGGKSIFPPLPLLSRLNILMERKVQQFLFGKMLVISRVLGDVGMSSCLVGSFLLANIPSLVCVCARMQVYAHIPRLPSSVSLRISCCTPHHLTFMTCPINKSGFGFQNSLSKALKIPPSWLLRSTTAGAS